MVKYKLIKKYPGSPSKIGYITNFDENEEDWNSECLITTEDCRLFPELWEKIEEPILTTEDGVDIFDKNELLWDTSDVNWTYLDTTPAEYFHTLPSHRKAWKHKSNAKEYIDKNKPQYSKKDMLDFATDYNQQVILYGTPVLDAFNNWKLKKNG